MTNPSTLTLIWGLVGLALLAAEMMTGTFILLFFGISSLFVALVRLSGFNSLALDVLLFAAIGALGLFFFRPRLREAFERKNKGYDVDRNSVFTLSSDIAPNGSTSIQYQGSTWTAVNAGDTPLVEGHQVRVTKVEGVKIHIVSAEKGN